MLTINLKERFRNKTFLLAMIGAIVLLIQQLGFKDIIPSNYADVVNTVLTILTMLGIVVDTSTVGVSDKVVSDATDKELEANAIVDASSNVQVSTDSSVNAAINDNSTPVVDTATIQAENEQLKATLAQIQLTAAGVTVQA